MKVAQRVILYAVVDSTGHDVATFHDGDNAFVHARIEAERTGDTYTIEYRRYSLRTIEVLDVVRP